MKKLLYIFAAVATALAAAGCAREMVATDSSSETVKASFTVRVPGDAATKAVSTGSSVNQLLFFAYDNNGKHLDLDQTVEVSGLHATVTVDLVKGLTYKFVFWAQKSGQYTALIDAESGVLTVNPTDMMNNDDWDAFCYYEEKAVTEGFSESITLHRPFAQLNVGSPAPDFTNAAKSGIATDDALLTSYKLMAPTKLNFLGMEVGDEAAEVAMTPAAHFTDDQLSVSGTSYDYVAMAYILAPGDEKALTDVTLTLNTTQNGAPIELTREVANVPLMANYRTNILGRIFTVTSVFEITVDPIFYTPEFNEDLETTIAKANTLFAAGNTYASIAVSPEDAGDNVTTITLPATTENVQIRLNFVSNETITIQYAESGDKPETVEIFASHVAKVVANLTSSTVYVSSGSWIGEGDFATAPTTLIIEEDAVVGNLTLRAGSIKVYGSITGVLNATGDAAGTPVECVLPAGNVEMPTSVNTPISFEGEVDENGDNLTTINISAATTINANDVSFKNINISGSPSISITAPKASLENVVITGTYPYTNYGGINLYGTAAGDDDVMVFKNVTITKAFKALHIFHTGTVRIEDCYLDAVYPFNCNGSKGNMIVTNTTLKGWTSYNNGAVADYTVSFDNCTFGASDDFGYSFTRPYNSTTYTDCTFESGYSIGGSTSNCKEGDKVILTFVNCTYAGSPFTFTSNCLKQDYMAAEKHGYVIEGKNYYFENEVLKGENTAEVLATTTEALGSAAAEEDAVVLLPSGTFDIPASIAEGVTIDGGENDVIINVGATALAGDDISVRNVTIQRDETTGSSALTVRGSVTLENIAIESEIDRKFGISLSGGTDETEIEIKNVSFGFTPQRAIMLESKGDITIEDCELRAGYCLSTLNDTNYGNVTVNNCTLAGWTSYNVGDGHTVSFNNCNFEQGSYWTSYGYPDVYGRLLKPYVTTTLTGCTFCESFYLDLSALLANQTVKLINCKIGGTVITSENITTLLGGYDETNSRYTYTNSIFEIVQFE